MDYINGFLYIETTLHPRDEAYLIMVNNDWSEVLFWLGLCVV
ncbi:hypothetical protein T11_8539 [Trichinella zimbabwensis]|uniref:Uncharacterized protein n=1 Tax=Trichinella zimbabwensis TaxID=268475 RepID=A0A0V1DUS2_9BILA|nr:hypothetical protein T11_8539 [Trichinella zimbabwensis]